MGEAKRRKEEHSRWLTSLDAESLAIATSALLAHKRIVDERGMTGGCYQLAFFLTRYLAERHGITARPVVGWVNDGTTPLMISHAWIESAGGITDISLTLTEHPEHQLPGALLVLGRAVYRGHADYTYHLERSQQALDALREVEAEVPTVVQMKEAHHSQMTAISRDSALIREYLDNAPPGSRYVDLVRCLA